MAATKWNQNINAGQDWMADINLLSANGASTRDITDHTLESKVKRHWKSVSEITSINIRVMDELTGNIRLSLNNTQSSLMRGGKYVYDIELKSPPTLTVKNVTGLFVAGETITGAVSGATGTVLTHITTKITYTITSGIFTGTEIINGTSFNSTLVANEGQPVDRVIEGVLTVKPEVTT
tara:strand:+ start:284 stop:820 length:537 start_codon:yes stop_codon:yes gene_type:complete